MIKMDYQTKLDVIRELNQAFGHRPTPERVAIIGVPDDKSIRQIEDEFCGMARCELNYKHASTLIIDSTLISSEAFWFFVPKIAELVLLDQGDYYMFANRLEDLGTTGLSNSEIEAMKKLLHLLRSLQQELDSDE